MSGATSSKSPPSPTIPIIEFSGKVGDGEALGDVVGDGSGVGVCMVDDSGVGVAVGEGSGVAVAVGLSVGSTTITGGVGSKRRTVTSLDHAEY